MNPRWLGAASVSIALLMGIAVFTFAATANGSGAGEVTLYVPGALNVSVYCAGKTTHFADGERITLLPEDTTCDIEAPLSPVMPLRGQIELTRATSYRCERKAMDLVCSPGR